LNVADVIWALGTDSSEKLRETLRDYLGAKLAANKAQLPRRHHHVLLEGARQKTGVCVIVATQPDNEQAWPYKDAGRVVLEERHGIAIVVKADAKSGGGASVLKTFGFIRALFHTPDERAALQSLGVQNLHETIEGLEGVGGEDEESLQFRRQLNLSATTDIYLT
jgi:hypothetical protein